MKKNKNTGCILFVIICVCFISGIFAGSFIQNIFPNIKELNNFAVKEVLPQNLPFYMLFIKNSKFFLIILALSFLSIGIPVIMSVFAITGLLYGYAFSYVLSGYGMGGFKSFIISALPYYIFKTVPVIISGCFASWVIMRKFVSQRPSKSYLKREKEKNVTEFIIVFIISCIAAFFACYVETRLSGNSIFF